MLAAAVSSIWRAAAPISRMGGRKWRRLREPSVFCPPYVASSPRAWAILTRDQSASSSSATAIGSAVRTPWPISDRCATMVTRPVSSMDTNAVGLKRGTSTAGAAGRLLTNPRGRRRSPITGPPAPAAPPPRKLRRLRFSRIAAISCPSCRGLDRRTDPLIGAAATDVAGHRLVDIVIGGLRGLGEQAGRLHDLPTLAVAALRDVQAAPRGLDALADRCSADPLDGRDLLAFRSRDRRDARARRRTIQVHRARAATPVRRPTARPSGPRNSAMIARTARGPGIPDFVMKPMAPLKPWPPNQPSVFWAPWGNITTASVSLSTSGTMLPSV